jgi:hypothetical protein
LPVHAALARMMIHLATSLNFLNFESVSLHRGNHHQGAYLFCHYLHYCIRYRPGFCVLAGSKNTSEKLSQFMEDHFDRSCVIPAFSIL